MFLRLLISLSVRNNFSGAIAILNNTGYATVRDTGGPNMSESSMAYPGLFKIAMACKELHVLFFGRHWILTKTVLHTVCMTWIQVTRHNSPDNKRLGNEWKRTSAHTGSFGKSTEQVSQLQGSQKLSYAQCSSQTEREK
jgi:hypothetical protein